MNGGSRAQCIHSSRELVRGALYHTFSNKFCVFLSYYVHVWIWWDSLRFGLTLQRQFSSVGRAVVFRGGVAVSSAGGVCAFQVLISAVLIKAEGPVGPWGLAGVQPCVLLLLLLQLLGLPVFITALVLWWCRIFNRL